MKLPKMLAHQGSYPTKIPPKKSYKAGISFDGKAFQKLLRAGFASIGSEVKNQCPSHEAESKPHLHTLHPPSPWPQLSAPTPKPGNPAPPSSPSQKSRDPLPKLPKKNKNSLVFPPYTPDEIKALGLDYKAQNLIIPQGWTKEGIAQVQRLGYSVAGVHNLRPSSRAWTPAQLVEHTTTLTPYVLDPRLMGREELYSQGSIEAEGFESSAKLYAEREKS